MKKELSIGSNGYFFIDRIRVTEEEFREEEQRQKIDEIHAKLDDLIKYLKI